MSDEHECSAPGCDYTSETKQGVGIHRSWVHDESSRGVTNEKLLQEIRDLRDRLGHTPSSAEMEEYGEYSITAYYNHFESWNAAVESVGFEPYTQRTAEKDELIDEIQSLAEDIGATPTLRDVTDHSPFGITQFYNAFGSWNTALQSAGFQTHNEIGIDTSKLIDEIHRLRDSCGRVPTAVDMKEDGEYSRGTYLSKFGSWNAALDEAGYQPHRRYISAQGELLDELERLGDELGRRPSAIDMKEDGEYSIPSYQRTFGSWNNALEAAGFDPWEHPDGIDHPNWRGGNSIRDATVTLLEGDWGSIREDRLESTDQKCEKCGASESDVKRGLSGHHIVPVRSGGVNSSPLCMILCDTCHTGIEWVMRDIADTVLIDWTPEERPEGRLSGEEYMAQTVSATIPQGQTELSEFAE